MRCLLSAEARAALARHAEGVGPFETGKYVLEAPAGRPDEPEESLEAMLVSLTRAELDAEQGSAGAS